MLFYGFFSFTRNCALWLSQRVKCRWSIRPRTTSPSQSGLHFTYLHHPLGSTWHFSWITTPKIHICYEAHLPSCRTGWCQPTRIPVTEHVTWGVCRVFFPHNAAGGCLVCGGLTLWGTRGTCEGRVGGRSNQIQHSKWHHLDFSRPFRRDIRVRIFIDTLKICAGTACYYCRHHGNSIGGDLSHWLVNRLRLMLQIWWLVKIEGKT